MCYKQKCKVVSLNLAHPVDIVCDEWFLLWWRHAFRGVTKKIAPRMGYYAISLEIMLRHVLYTTAVSVLCEILSP